MLNLCIKRVAFVNFQLGNKRLYTVKTIKFSKFNALVCFTQCSLFHFCLTLILRSVREKLNSFRRKIIQEKKTIMKIYLLKCPWLLYLFQDEFGEDCFSSYEGLKEDTQIIVRYDGKCYHQLRLLLLWTSGIKREWS